METLKRKYGLWMAVAMMVGIVIGSGIFFKADDVLIKSGGSLPLALLAWLVGGLIMVFSVYSFSFAAGKISKSNGLVDYIEAGYGKNIGYYVAWFMSWIYYPTLAGVLAWVSGLYTSVLFGLVEGDPSNALPTWIIAVVYFVGAFALNYLSPILAGKFQVSAMVIKLIPITLVAVVGLIVGLFSGVTLDNFAVAAEVVASNDPTGLAVAVLATAFAYDGWIAATSINAELKDPKRNLPLALIIGAGIVISAYLLYNIGLVGVLDSQQFVDLGNEAVTLAVNQLFGPLAGTALTVFVVISCLGTLNGLTLGASRGMYSVAVRGRGAASHLFVKVSKQNTPMYSVIGGAVVSALWFVVWYGNFNGWWGGFLDTSELPIAMLYAINIAVYIWIMRTFIELNWFKRFVVPALAIAGSLYIVYGAVQKELFAQFLSITIVILVVGYVADFFKKPVPEQVEE